MRPRDEAMHSSYKNWRWWSVALRGLAAIVFGVLAIARPAAAVASLVMLFGIYAIVDGVLALALGARTTLVPRGAMYGRALISIIAGVVALAMPAGTAVAFLVLLAAWAILSGIIEIVMAIRLRDQMKHEWLLGLEGVLSIAFGVLLIVSPLIGVMAIGVWVGAYALVLGGMLVVTGFRLRDHEHGVSALEAGAHAAA